LVQYVVDVAVFDMEDFDQEGFDIGGNASSSYEEEKF